MMKSTRSSSRKKPRYELRIAGSGGQGVALAGTILAEAVMLDGKYVALTQSYGAQVRGGSSSSDIVLDDSEIDYPLALEFNLLIALNQEACDRSIGDLQVDGLAVVDSDLVRRVTRGKVVSIPFRRIAQEVGEERAVGVASLGAIACLCPGISRDSLSKVITKRVPAKKLEANLQAFGRAMDMADKLKGSLERIEAVDIREEFEA